jgi:hypothetical protein
MQVWFFALFYEHKNYLWEFEDPAKALLEIYFCFNKNVPNLEVGNRIITEPQFIAEAFADHFSSVLTPKSAWFS